jgi:hypothetical protein
MNNEMAEAIRERAAAYREFPPVGSEQVAIKKAADRVLAANFRIWALSNPVD